MKNFFNNPGFAFCIILSIALGSVSAAADESTAGLRKTALNWERAAMSREWAGFANIEQASVLVRKAQSYREQETTNDVIRMKYLVLSAAKEQEASAMYGLAVANYDKANINWSKAASIYSSIGEQENAGRARDRGCNDYDKATELCEQAALCAERAIEAFGPDGVDDLKRMGKASELAAVWWERVAARK